MCGRFYVDDEMLDEVRKICHNLDIKYENKSRKGDVYPSQKAVIIQKNHAGGLQAVDCQWGYPARTGKGLLINARAETVQEKVTFRDDYAYRRCVIPVRAFYEWNGNKDKYCFKGNDKKESVMFLAGIYTLIEDGRFTILTTGANEQVRPIHDRMPVIITGENITDWIYGELGIRKMGNSADQIELKTERMEDQLEMRFE